MEIKYKNLKRIISSTIIGGVIGGLVYIITKNKGDTKKDLKEMVGDLKPEDLMDESLPIISKDVDMYKLFSRGDHNPYI
ncbi:MAG: hypothetical protein QXD05_02800 [Candidatus Pacearchaeota archaeon]